MVSDEKHALLAEHYRNLIKKNKGLRHQVECALNTLKIKEKALHLTTDREKFLVNRIRTIYGVKALHDLLNTVEIPGGFDSEGFTRAQIKRESRKNEDLTH